MSLRMSIDSPGDLEALAAKLDSLQGKSWEPPIHKAIAPAVEEGLRNQFANGTTPSGRGWKAKKTGEASRLTASGDMKGTAMALPGPHSTQVSIASPAQYHQFGTSKMVAREILPQDGRMPKIWKPYVEEAANAALEDWLEKTVIT